MPPPKPNPQSLLSSTPRPHRLSYRVGRGEQGVLTFEPYKSALLPLWRFRDADAARASAAALWGRFEAFAAEGDFVGMDMARKFVQMGMTRAKRYANRPGGRKYRRRREGGGEEEELPISAEAEKTPDQREKERASLVFRKYWERCKAHEGYRRSKEEFLREQKAWDKRVKENEVKDDQG